MKMQPVIEQIVEKLGQETQGFRDLLKLVEEEREILLSGRHENLIPLSEQKLGLTQRLAETQQQRRALMQKLSPDHPLKLGDLVAYLPRERRNPFKTALKTLSALAERLTGLNQKNAVFIGDALDTVEHLLAILTGQDQKEAYGARGAAISKPSMPRLLTREV
jgi:flagellar biosynthesis/type III secretory pathway chaperone